MKVWRDKTKVCVAENHVIRGKMTSEGLTKHLEIKNTCVYHRYISNYLKLNYYVEDGKFGYEGWTLSILWGKRPKTQAIQI